MTFIDFCCLSPCPVEVFANLSTQKLKNIKKHGGLHWLTTLAKSLKIQPERKKGYRLPTVTPLSKIPFSVLTFVSHQKAQEKTTKARVCRLIAIVFPSNLKQLLTILHHKIAIRRFYCLNQHKKMLAGSQASLSCRGLFVIYPHPYQKATTFLLFLQ